ncbi:hypothetical protein [Nostoc sp.]|uniref:hypothetical protein n=1 Tax=Nostoc sp. TaxID=1180 RepID=UPI002FF47C41
MSIRDFQKINYSISNNDNHFKDESFSNLQELRQRIEHELAQMSSLVISSLTSYDFILEALFHEALFYVSS